MQRAALERERSELLEAIDKINTLVKKIRHGCMVPISKVAFVPGSLIHTNEYFLRTDQNAAKMHNLEENWKSHVEAAAELQARVEAIDVLLHGPAVAASSPKEQPLPPAPNAKTKKLVAASAPAAAPAPAPAPSDEASGGIFEIREYFDECSRLVKHDIVDLERELEAVQNSLGGADLGDGQGGGAGGAENETEAAAKAAKRAAARKAVSDLESKLKGLGGDGAGGGAKEDADAAFVRELHVIAARAEEARALRATDGGFFDGAVPDDEGYFQGGEEEYDDEEVEGGGEEEDEEEEEEDVDGDIDLGFFERLAAEEERAKSQRDRITPGGWGKGFLGKEKKPAAVEAVKKPAEAPAKPASRSVAFSDAPIMEKFP